MRIRSNLPEIDKNACDAIIKGLEERMSPMARHYRKRVSIMKNTVEKMPDEQKKRLHDMRVGKLSSIWGHRNTRWTQALKKRFAIGQLIAMPDRKYYGIIQEASANGITPGMPFMLVAINRNKAHYIMAINGMEDIPSVLQRNACLAGKTIMKAYNKKRDTWTLYAQFGARYLHVADVFGLDLTTFKEYVQTYVPSHEKKIGRPRKPILHEFI